MPEGKGRLPHARVLTGILECDGNTVQGTPNLARLGELGVKRLGFSTRFREEH